MESEARLRCTERYLSNCSASLNPPSAVLLLASSGLNLNFSFLLFSNNSQYVTLRRRKDDWESVTTSHPDYIRFYNSLWLVANDVIIGIALGSYIIDNSAWVAESISEILSRYSIAALQKTISWLMVSPAGLKLNNELAAFLGDLFLWVIDHWSSECSPFASKIYV